MALDIRKWNPFRFMRDMVDEGEALRIAAELPGGVDVQRAEAIFANGVLTLRLPKQENTSADSSHTIEIK